MSNEQTGRQSDIARLKRRLRRVGDVARAQRRHLADAVEQIEYLDGELDDAAATEETFRRALVEVRQMVAEAGPDAGTAGIGELLARIVAVTAAHVDAAQGPRGCTHLGQTGALPCPVCGVHAWSCSCLACLSAHAAKDAA